VGERGKDGAEGLDSARKAQRAGKRSSVSVRQSANTGIDDRKAQGGRDAMRVNQCVIQKQKGVGVGGGRGVS
jgi:hypothetical protein